MPKYSFQHERRLKTSEQFRDVFQSPIMVKSRYFFVYVLPRENKARIGVIVSKKVSKRAVFRNAIRRAVKEQFRLIPELTGDIVFVGRRSLVDTELCTLPSCVKQLLQQCLQHAEMASVV